MKTLEEYMETHHMEIVEDTIEGGYAAYFPDLPGCITCADTLEELMDMAEDAKRVWLEATLEDGLEISEPTVCPLEKPRFSVGTWATRQARCHAAKRHSRLKRYYQCKLCGGV